jgi:aquaporin Z
VERSLGQRLTAEFIGTFALIFIGAGSIVQFVALGGGNVLAVAFAHGLAIAVMVSALGHVSGAHFNPAVTIGMLATAKIAFSDAMAYIGAQLVGALAGAAALQFLMQDAIWKAAKLGVPTIAGNTQLVSTGQAVVIEAILTFFLVWVVFATAVDPAGSFGKIAGLAIGLTITMDILMGGAFTGAAMNRARWVGPAFMGWISGESGYWANSYVWIIGPIAGGIVAASVYDWVILSKRGTGGSAVAEHDHTWGGHGEETGTPAPHAWGAHGEDADAVRDSEE